MNFIPVNSVSTQTGGSNFASIGGSNSESVKGSYILKKNGLLEGLTEDIDTGLIQINETVG